MSQQSPTAAERVVPAPEAKPAPAAVLKERWTQLVALTTTVFAVCAAISSLKGGGYATKVQLATARENDKWAQYQSKSLKQNLFVVEQNLLQIQALEARAPETKAAIAARLPSLQAEIDRYDQEKAKLKTAAEALQLDETTWQRTLGTFGLAVMLLQIAIMLSSVGALMKKPMMWAVGLLFGSVGLAYMANGFFGWW